MEKSDTGSRMGTMPKFLSKFSPACTGKGPGFGLVDFVKGVGVLFSAGSVILVNKPCASCSKEVSLLSPSLLAASSPLAPVVVLPSSPFTLPVKFPRASVTSLKGAPPAGAATHDVGYSAIRSTRTIIWDVCFLTTLRALVKRRALC